MPELIEQMFCSQQIVIPPKYPYILKRFCKAAIKTQPYDLLRWSFEYFKALAERRPPPVKLRLEYPIYSTEGGLSRGCLKVLANQLGGMVDIPLPMVRAAWQGFCLDPCELKRVLCLCEVYRRADDVPFLHFIAVAGGLLTKNLTHTMILLCESLTKEPDGGSAAIPISSFLTMYKFLAEMDASKDVRYLDGHREGSEEEEILEEAEEEKSDANVSEEMSLEDDFWAETDNLQKNYLSDDPFPKSVTLSLKLTLPVIGKISRSPSAERAGQIERDNYMRERKERAARSDEIDNKLREMSGSTVESQEGEKEDVKKLAKESAVEVKTKEEMRIVVEDEDGVEIPLTFYGEPDEVQYLGEEEEKVDDILAYPGIEEAVKEEEKPPTEKDIIAQYVADILAERQARLDDLEQTFYEIEAIVEKFKTTSYDLGMIAGRQMSTTSGEFIVQYVEKEIMDYINEQIAILPDPDLKKKKAKPEEVEMIRNMLYKFVDDNMDVIVPEVEEVEEAELPIPEVIMVYAVPGIGGPVDKEIMADFIEFAQEACQVQGDLFMPRNIRHFLCPPLEKVEEPKYEEINKNEEVVTGGIITD